MTKSKIEKLTLNSVPQSKIDYEPNSLSYTVDFKYTPDFGLTTKSGKYILIETKGGRSYKYFDGSYRKKWLAMYNQYKDTYDIRLMFETDFKVSKTMRASDWCNKYGIQYTIGMTIPKKWYNE